MPDVHKRIGIQAQTHFAYNGRFIFHSLLRVWEVKEIKYVIFQKRVRVFHRGFKHEKTDESTRPRAECFYCFRCHFRSEVYSKVESEPKHEVAIIERVFEFRKRMAFFVLGSRF